MGGLTPPTGRTQSGPPDAAVADSRNHKGQAWQRPENAVDSRLNDPTWMFEAAALFYEESCMSRVTPKRALHPNWWCVFWAIQRTAGRGVGVSKTPTRADAIGPPSGKGRGGSNTPHWADAIGPPSGKGRGGLRPPLGGRNRAPQTRQRRTAEGRTRFATRTIHHIQVFADIDDARHEAGRF